MSFSEKLENENKFDPPTIHSFSCKQIDIFQDFLCNTKEQREKLSNAVPLWDCLPRYSLSRKAAEKLRKERLLPALLSLKCKHLGREFTVVIQPARILNADGNVIEYYPSASDELVEDCLRKIATIQNQGFFEEKSRKLRSGVTFSIYQLRAELKKQGHTRSYKEIVLSLHILSRSIIEIKTDGQKNKAFITSAYFRSLSCVSRSDLTEDPDAKWFVEFHPLITQAIYAIDYRQFNYELMMSHSTQLSRWLYKYLVIKFIGAKFGEKFDIRFSTVKRDSGLLNSYSRNRASIEKLKESLKELKSNNVLESFKEEKIIGAQGQVEDVIFTIFPTIKFVSEIKAANKRLADAQKLVHQS